MNDNLKRPNSYDVWLSYAQEDIEAAQQVSSFRNACMLAQQGAEKALKAVILFQGKELMKTHDLCKL